IHRILFYAFFIENIIFNYFIKLFKSCEIRKEGKATSLAAPLLLDTENDNTTENDTNPTSYTRFHFSTEVNATIAAMTQNENESLNETIDENPNPTVELASDGDVSVQANEKPAEVPPASEPPPGPKFADILPALQKLFKRLYLATRDRVIIVAHVCLWCVVIMPIAAIIGIACAIFLWGLNKLTHLRFDYPWLLFLLPVGGVCIALSYRTFGRETRSGNNLILDEIYQPRNKNKNRGSVPSRMAPLILLTTWTTHLFGGSAGREGTAIQMAVSLMSTYARILREYLHIHFGQEDTRTLFVSGIAAGFGGIFGTPIAATTFAVEVLVAGAIGLDTIGPALIGSGTKKKKKEGTSLTADWFGRLFLDLLSSSHTEYDTPCFRMDQCFGHMSYSDHLDFDWVFMLKVVIASIFFGLTASLFAWGMHNCGRFFKWLIPNPKYHIFHPVVGGTMIIIMRYMFDNTNYLGIGTIQPPGHPEVVTIVTAFNSGGSKPASWLLKLIFTVVTLTSGFKGGEVTPLFYIGATLGNTLTETLFVPKDLTNVFAAIGFVAVFGAATNTPLSSFIMGIELFGGNHAVYMGTSCIVAYIASASNSIYSSQKLQSDFKIVMRLAEQKLGCMVQRDDEH
ncbi:Chloride channel core, partial [Reticulomyxa filosa]